MERNSQSTPIFGGKAIFEQVPRHVSSFSMCSSGNDFGKLGSFSLCNNKNTYDDVVAAPASSAEPMIRLRLGRQKEVIGDHSDFPPPGSDKAAVYMSPFPAKRSRASYQSMQNPCCQVEGCNLDLKSAKDYHRRHRICEAHSKSPRVIVAGLERRFCQQCSRFHGLSEFDDKKRSCRKRLCEHNARRRRVPPESVQLNSAGLLSSALYDQGQQNMLLNGLPVSLSSSTWENAKTSMFRQPRDLCIRPPPKAQGFEQMLRHSSVGILDQCLHASTTNSQTAPDLPVNSHSLLSSNCWRLNEAESVPMDCSLVPGNYKPVVRLSEPHQWSLFEPNMHLISAAEQGPPVPLAHSINLHTSNNRSNAGTSHLQQPYHSACFYSNQRNL